LAGLILLNREAALGYYCGPQHLPDGATAGDMANDSDITGDKDVAEKLGIGAKGASRRRWRWLVLGLVVVVAAGIAVYFTTRNGASGPAFQTVAAKTGDLTVIVTATGTLQPVNQVDVGAEISGRIETVLVDYNERVHRGQVLAEFDTDLLKVKVDQARAALLAAEAAMAEAQATLIEKRAKLARTKALAARGTSSQQDLDAAQAEHDRAAATLSKTIAQVTQARATLEAEQTTLSKARVRSPIDGIIIERKVEPGQTVASTFQTPVLFKVAEDLKRMELIVDIDEADIGNVREGQKATFTVDTYLGRNFNAVIKQVRFAPQTKNDVVTYQAVLTVNNDDLLLRPGMTATANIVTLTRKNVLLIPNRALRFAPPATMLSRAQRTRLQRDTGKERVWLLTPEGPQPVAVTTGPTDGEWTELASGDIKPGAKLIVDLVQPNAGAK
jgi:HlyD family secretion protein